MSRLHDALRRGRSRAGPPASPRPGHADAVLAALGYPAGRRRPRGAAGLIVVSAIGVAAFSVWSLIPWRQIFAPAAIITSSGSPPATSNPEDPKRGEVRQNPAIPRLSAGRLSSPPPDSRPAPTVSASVAVQASIPAERTVHASIPKPHPSVVASPAAKVRARAPVTIAQPPVTKPNAATPPGGPASDDFQLALYYQRAGDFEQALVHYKAILQRDEMSLDVHNNIGNLYMAKGLFPDAEREFRRVVAIEPSYIAARINLSAALYQQKRFDEAAAEARAALAIDARSQDAYVNLALAQSAAGQIGDAGGSLRRALEIDKRNAAAHYNLALEYEKSGEAALALDHYRLFLQYAGPEQAAYAADVRSRMQALTARLK